MLAADRRALRARALACSAAVLILLASLLRVLAGSVGKARARRRLQALPRAVASETMGRTQGALPPPQPSLPAAAAVAGGGAEGRLKAA